MKKLLLAILLCLLPITAYAQRLEAYVERVVDGDTLQININGKIEKLRMIGVDTPETVKRNNPVQPYGLEASSYTKKHLDGKTIYIEFDVGRRDRYRRLLAYVWLSPDETDQRKMFNSQLLLRGYARLMTIQPNIKYVDCFRQYQVEARESQRGLWK